MERTSNFNHTKLSNGWLGFERVNIGCKTNNLRIHNRCKKVPKFWEDTIDEEMWNEFCEAIDDSAEFPYVISLRKWLCPKFLLFFIALFMLLAGIGNFIVGIANCIIVAVYPNAHGKHFLINNIITFIVGAVMGIVGFCVSYYRYKKDKKVRNNWETDMKIKLRENMKNLNEKYDGKIRFELLDETNAVYDIIISVQLEVEYVEYVPDGISSGKSGEEVIVNVVNKGNNLRANLLASETPSNYGTSTEGAINSYQ